MPTPVSHLGGFYPLGANVGEGLGQYTVPATLYSCYSFTIGDKSELWTSFY